MKKPIRGVLVLAFVLALLASFGGALGAEANRPEVEYGTESSFGTVVREAAQASVAKPKVSQAAGTYTSSVKVKLTTTTKSAKIYYTTDGSMPTAKSKEYTKTLTLKKNITLKAVAIKSGKSSSVLTAAYKVSVAAPQVNKAAGKYAASVSVKLSSETAGAKIYYTTDGSTPTTKSTLYSKAIKVTKTTTIKALSVKSGLTKSKVVSFKYTFFENTYTNREGYLACSSKEKKVYTVIYNGLAKREEEIEMPVRIKLSAALRVMMRVNLDNPELIVWGTSVFHYTDGDYLETLVPEYTLSESEYFEMQKALKSAAEKIAAKARKEKKVSGQVRVIHDEIILKAEYDEEAADGLDWGEYDQNAFSAYGVLVEKIGVCESYSRAFQYVCQLLDIPALLVVGNVGGNHMWNMVKVGENWYHIDLTWDDPYFGKSDYIGYEYFLVSTAKMSKTRTISPIAKGNQAMTELYNYFTIPNAPKSF